MDDADKVKVPILEEVIVQGNKVAEPVDISLNLLDEDQATLLSQQIEEIIQERLQAALMQAVADIKAHLDDVLPLLIDQVLNPIEETELATKPTADDENIK